MQDRDRKLEFTRALLCLVANNCDVDRVVNNYFGMEYYDVAKEIDALIEQNLLDITDQGLTMTPVGSTYLRVLNRKMGIKGIYEYIIPEYSVLHEARWSIDELYIPMKFKIRRK